MKQLWKFFILTLIMTLILPMFQTVDFEISAQPSLDINAKSAILVDNISGKILYEKEPDIPLPPASMTKMMTEYLILEAIDSGKIKWDDIVTASEYAHWMGTYGGSRVFLALGEKRNVKELMYAMAVYSANDATIALAEHVAGSESAFVNLMNEKAKEFGMDQTHFLTSTGFPANQLEEFTPQIDGDHVMSARDSAILAWHLLNDYPDILSFTSTPRIKFREEQANPMNLPNWNWMLPGLIYEYEGVDGLKTGSTEAAGFNFTATAERNGVRLISVVLATESKEERFVETKKLLDYGFANYETVTLVKAKEIIEGYETVPVQKGKETKVPVITKNDITILIKKGEQELYKPVISLNQNIVAPIKSEDIVGYTAYEYTGQEKYDYLNDEIKANEQIALIAKEDVDKASGFRLFFRKIISIISGIFGGIVEGIKGLF